MQQIKRKSDLIYIWIFLLPVIIIFLSIFAIPIVRIIITSSYDWNGFTEDKKFVGFLNYKKLLNDEGFLISFKNTIFWIFSQGIIHVSLGVLIAFILSDKIIGWKSFRVLYMIPNIISPAALGIVFLNVFNPEIGLVNNIIRKIGFLNFYLNWFFDKRTDFLTVTIIITIYAGLITVLVLAQIMVLPTSLVEAARIDGASNLQIKIKIILPQLRNIIGTCVILAMTSMLVELELIMLTTGGSSGFRTSNLPLYLYKTVMLENNYGYGNTIGVVIILLGVFIVLSVSKIFRIGQGE